MRPATRIALIVLLFSLLAPHANAQFPNIGGDIGGGLSGLFGSAKKKAMEKAQDLISQQIAQAAGVNAPLHLDQSAAYASVDTPVGFHPKLLTPRNAADLNRPLPPGDYVVPVVGYCTALGVPSPGQGLPEKIAPLQGKQAEAVTALVARGTVARTPVHTIQAMVWRIEDGVPVSQWSDADQATVHQLIPDHEKELNGDYVQQIQDNYQKYARYGLPSIDTMMGKAGAAGQLVQQLRAARQTLANKSISDERLPQLLYQQTGAGGSQPPVTATGADASPSPWSEIQPGVIARFTTVGGYDARNRFEFRISPQAAQATEAPVPAFRAVQFTQTPAISPGQVVRGGITLGRILRLRGGLLLLAGEAVPGLDVLDTMYIVYTLSNSATQPLLVAPIMSDGGDQGGNGGNNEGNGESSTGKPKGLNPQDVTIEDKIKDQMGPRGWTEQEIENTVENPDKTVETTDTRHNLDGSTRNDPATGYINADGSYVVVNDTDNTIVQISNKNKPGWKAPWDKK